MKLAVICIYALPVTPNFMIVELTHEDWLRFRASDKLERIKMIRPFIKKPGPSDIVEVAWIPLEGLSSSEFENLESECRQRLNLKKKPQ